MGILQSAVCSLDIDIDLANTGLLIQDLLKLLTYCLLYFSSMVGFNITCVCVRTYVYIHSCVKSLLQMPNREGEDLGPEMELYYLSKTHSVMFSA